MADDYFERSVRDGNSILRLLHYPPAPFDGPNVRAGAHEDINTITLLLGAEEAGLEVKDRDGRWLAINPPSGSVVCNIGDMLQPAEQSCPALDDPPSGEPRPGAARRAPLFDAVLPAFRAGLLHRNPVELHKR